MDTTNNPDNLTSAQRIEDAFVSLLQSKTFKEITVSDICSIAEINRSTFYNYYKDLSMLSDAFSQKVEELILKQPREDKNFTWVFTYIKNNPEMFTAYFKLKVRYDASDYKDVYIRNGFHSVAKYWFENGCVESPEFMGNLSCWKTYFIK